MKLWLWILALLSICCGTALAALSEPPLAVGILSFRPKEATRAQWSPLSPYLEAALGRRVEVSAYFISELDAAVNQNAVDVVLCNSGFFFHLKHRHGLSAPLATLVPLENGQRLMAFGGVVFARAERSDMTTLADLAGRRIATPGKESFGGYQMQAFELIEAGLAPPRDADIFATGMPQSLTVDAVLAGKAEAGFVRTGILESMAREGKLDLGRIRVIHRQNLPAFPYASSTRLYPEWPVAVMPQVEERLARRLTVALLSLPPGVIKGVDGFANPADYSGVEAVLRALRVAPFDAPPRFDAFDIWSRYRYAVLAFAAASMAILLLALSLLMGNRRLERAQQAARSSALRYRHLLDTAIDGVHILDREGRVVEASDSFYRMLGHPKGTALRVMDWDAQWTPEQLLEKLVELLRPPGSPALFQTRHRRRDGQVIEVEINAQGIAIDGEALVYASSRDITERKRAEAELERHRDHLEELVQERTAELSAAEARARQIIECAADGLYGLDAEGRLSFVNPASCRMLGHAAEALLGQSAHALFHHSRPDGSPYPEEECPLLACLRAGQAQRAEDEVYWHADGHPIPVMYAAHPLWREGKIAGAVVSFVDLSGIRAAEQAREQALVAAENLARARREFLANMSHEIRTPLNGILGFAQIGLRQSNGEGKAGAAFSRIIESGQLLLGIVNDILDFSKVEQGKLAVESVPVDLLEEVRQSLGLVQEKARAKGLALKVRKQPGLPSHCLSDPLRLKQILVNLLSNAVKFTDAGSIAFSASLEGGELLFDIADTGVGMDASQLDRLFKPFEQADGSTTRKFGGTGLGLAITRHLVGLMGGRIEVESALGAGSRFRVVLPYRPCASPPRPEVRAAPAAAPAPPPLAGLAILVAEDNEINRCLLEENLRSSGARPALAEDGWEAVRRVREDGADAYDLVLMDIQMPELDGYEATRRIHEIAPGLPVIGQTAHAFGEEKDRCFAAGMVAHIAKPIDPEQLVELIRRHARPPATDE
jgi:PAS domain S-box-containing protein